MQLRAFGQMKDEFVKTLQTTVNRMELHVAECEGCLRSLVDEQTAQASACQIEGSRMEQLLAPLVKQQGKFSGRSSLRPLLAHSLCCTNSGPVAEMTGN